MTPEQILIDVQEQIFNGKGIRTDVYNIEGQGVLIVPEYQPLEPQNIIIQLPEHVILMGGKININFQ